MESTMPTNDVKSMSREERLRWFVQILEEDTAYALTNAAKYQVPNEKEELEEAAKRLRSTYENLTNWLKDRPPIDIEIVNFVYDSALDMSVASHIIGRYTLFGEGITNYHKVYLEHLRQRGHAEESVKKRREKMDEWKAWVKKRVQEMLATGRPLNGNQLANKIDEEKAEKKIPVNLPEYDRVRQYIRELLREEKMKQRPKAD